MLIRYGSGQDRPLVVVAASFGDPPLFLHGFQANQAYPDNNADPQQCIHGFGLLIYILSWTLNNFFPNSTYHSCQKWIIYEDKLKVCLIFGAEGFMGTVLLTAIGTWAGGYFRPVCAIKCGVAVPRARTAAVNRSAGNSLETGEHSWWKPPPLVQILTFTIIDSSFGPAYTVSKLQGIPKTGGR